MAEGTTKQRSEQHLIDQQGEALLRSKLPPHWVMREYRPDYGIDYSIEVFAKASAPRPGLYQTLGEHFFVQLKSVATPEVKPLAIFARGNVEKRSEVLDRADKVVDLDTYRFQLETSELMTVERMGIGVPVLLVIADLQRQRCSYVCLNDYIDKILVPRHSDYRAGSSRTVHIPARNEVGTEHGLVGLRWYAKRPKLIAAFQRFTYQYSELQWAAEDDWRSLANIFAGKIAHYDFWNDTEMCALIPYVGDGLRRFIETGQPQFFNQSGDVPEGVEEAHYREHMRQLDVFELWRQMSLLPKTYEDVWREWFLPTSLGHAASAPPETAAREQQPRFVTVVGTAEAADAPRPLRPYTFRHQLRDLWRHLRE